MCQLVQTWQQFSRFIIYTNLNTKTYCNSLYVLIIFKNNNRLFYKQLNVNFVVSKHFEMNDSKYFK